MSSKWWIALNGNVLVESAEYGRAAFRRGDTEDFDDFEVFCVEQVSRAEMERRRNEFEDFVYGNLVINGVEYYDMQSYEDALRKKEESLDTNI